MERGAFGTDLERRNSIGQRWEAEVSPRDQRWGRRWIRESSEPYHRGHLTRMRHVIVYRPLSTIAAASARHPRCTALQSRVHPERRQPFLVFSMRCVCGRVWIRAGHTTWHGTPGVCAVLEQESSHICKWHPQFSASQRSCSGILPMLRCLEDRRNCESKMGAGKDREGRWNGL